MDLTPDLSHLTEDERKIIEAVIQRQKAEEKRDAVTQQARIDDYSAPIAMAGRRFSQQTKSHDHGSSPNESGICCEVCQKTKFVGEQSARQCSVCKKRFCVRCGVRLKGHQILWLCNLCRQKQERYFSLTSSTKPIPSTGSASQLTTNSTNLTNRDDEHTQNISKQYVSDYILSQPFDLSTTNDIENIPQTNIQTSRRCLPSRDNVRRSQTLERTRTIETDEEQKPNNNGATSTIPPPPPPPTTSSRTRMLPTMNIQKTHPKPTTTKESKNDSSSGDDNDAVSSPDSTSVVDEAESVPCVTSSTAIIIKEHDDNKRLLLLQQQQQKSIEDSAQLISTSLPSSRSTNHNNNSTITQMQGRLREYQCHSLEDKEIGQESTLKDSGIDTASSSTILTSDPFKQQQQQYQPTTTWHYNDTHTSQIGYVTLKNNNWTSSRDEYPQATMIKADIFSALGLKVQGGISHESDDSSSMLIAEITKVTPRSIADSCGQLRVGDQVLEWNGQKLSNLNCNDVYRIISQSSLQSPEIHMIVKRPIRFPSSSTTTVPSQDRESTTKKNGNNNLRLQLSFQHVVHRRELHVTVHGARDLHGQQGSFACQLSIQFGRDSLSKEQKCTKPQACSAGTCTWNQRFVFFDIDTLDTISLWAKLVDLDRNQEPIGEICIPLNNKINLDGTPEWYYLIPKYSVRQSQTRILTRSDSDASEVEQHGPSSLNRVLPAQTSVNPNSEISSSTTTTDTTPISSRKRQLPNIPAAQLHANREKVSQDLIHKATQLKLRLHMQQQMQRGMSTNDESYSSSSYQQQQQQQQQQRRSSSAIIPSNEMGNDASNTPWPLTSQQTRGARNFDRSDLAQQKRQMYEDRIQIFNNEANRAGPLPPPVVNPAQRSSFQSSKSIDVDSSLHQHPHAPMPTKSYESMTNLSQKIQPKTITTTTGLKEKTLSRPRIPMIRDKSAPSSTTTRDNPAPYLNPSMSRRITTTGQIRIDSDRPKIKSFDDKYRKTGKKRDTAEIPGEDVDSDGSELSTASKISSVSMLSTQSERPRNTRKHGPHTRINDHHQQFHRGGEAGLNEEELRQMAQRTHDTSSGASASAAASITSATNQAAASVSSSTSEPFGTLINSAATNKVDPRNDGTLSDSILSTQAETGKKRRPSMSSKALVILGLSKKSNSASNLGYGKRFGFQRSEEIGVQPHLRNRTLQRQTSKENETPPISAGVVVGPPQSSLVSSHHRDQHHSMPHDMKLWSGGLKLPHEHQFIEFIEGLGTGQLVGRQVLASPCHGEIQVGLRDQHGLLEVEIVRARNLLQKALYKTPPAPYVKVYLLDGKQCIEKQRTRATRRTLDPLIQQTLTFKENYRQRVLQIGVWGDYGKLDRKVFMGVCQISLDDLSLQSSGQVLGWYKMFSANSLMNNYTIVQQPLRRKNSLTASDSPMTLRNTARF